MKVSIVRGGGFAGLVTTTTLDGDATSLGDADELNRRVQQAGVLDLPDKLTTSAAEADGYSYEIRVEDGDRKRTVRASDGALPADLRSLVAWVQSHPDAASQR